MRGRANTRTNDQAPSPARLTLSTWLRAGEEWFPAETLAPLRDQAKGRLAALRTEALAKAAALDDEMRALDKATTPFLSTFGSKAADVVPRGATPLRRPKRSARSKEASVPKLVQQIVAETPGVQAATVIAQVRSLKPGADDANIHSALYRLSKPGGPLRKEGTQGKFTFSLKETTPV